MSNEEDWVALSGNDGLDVVEWTAVDLICRQFLWPAAELNSDQAKLGTIAIADLGLLDGFIGGGLDSLLGGADSIMDKSGTHFGWPIAVAIARRVCETKTSRVMEFVLAEERRARGVASAARPWIPPLPRPSLGEELFESALWHELTQPSLDLLRSWCGEEAVTAQETLGRARSELSRLGEMFGGAVALIADAGDEAASWALFHAAYPEAKKESWRGTVALNREERLRWRAGLSRREA